jgi:hypothetical protein
MGNAPKKRQPTKPDPASPFTEDHSGCAAFQFHGAIRGEPPHPGIYPSVPQDRQREFEAAFYADIARVKQWFSDREWIPERVPLLSLPISATYRPDKNFHVFISEEYQFSRALVPAWSTQRGWMEFPAKRVVAGEAAIAHELVHVFFPNGNRFLAEGLAVYLHQCVGPNPCFPNYGMDLHKLVGQLLDADPFGSIEDFDKFSLVKLDRIPTPDDMTFRIGQEDCNDASVTYALAGSFVQFLIENCEPDAERKRRKCPTFRKLYADTPLVPLVRNAGRADRWKRIYGRPLGALEAEWKIFIKGQLPHKSAP